MTGPSLGGDPWADPATQTEWGAPYAGPPAPAPYGHQLGHGQSWGYGYPAPPGFLPPWGTPVPPAPRRPGQVTASAVLAFVQAGIVLVASGYVWFLISMLRLAARDNPDLPGWIARDVAREGTVLALVQLLSVALLVTAGIVALRRRTLMSWWLLVGAHGTQVLLTLAWIVRLLALAHDLPGPDPEGALVSFPLLFAAAPLVGLGMVLLGPGRRWYTGTAPA